MPQQKNKMWSLIAEPPADGWIGEQIDEKNGMKGEDPPGGGPRRGCPKMEVRARLGGTGAARILCCSFLGSVARA